MKFAVVINENGKDVILDNIDAWTVEEAKEIALHKFGEYYKKEELRFELAPREEFEYIVYWALEGDYSGSPTIEQELNAIYDFEAIQRKSTSFVRKKISKCVDCGRVIEYVTKPFKRCPKCKRKFERERKRRARSRI